MKTGEISLFEIKKNTNENILLNNTHARKSSTLLKVGDRSFLGDFDLIMKGQRMELSFNTITVTY